MNKISENINIENIKDYMYYVNKAYITLDNKEQRNYNCVYTTIATDLSSSGCFTSALPIERERMNVGMPITIISEFFGKDFRVFSSLDSIIEIMKNEGSGSKGIISLGFKGIPFNKAGHVFNVFNLDGEVVFFCGQNNEIWDRGFIEDKFSSQEVWFMITS